MFQERFRNEGGKFFDPDTMKATINSDIGVKVFTDMRAENKFMPPGVEQLGLRRESRGVPAGQSAMTISWPPYGRWAAGYGTERGGPDLGAEIDHRRQGRLCPAARRPSSARAGFALVGILDQQAQGRRLSVHPVAEQRGRQLERVQLPYALRDPFRDRHSREPEYLARWPEAQGLSGGAEAGFDQRSAGPVDAADGQVRGGAASGRSRLWAGEDPKAILDDVAAQWDAITEQIGVDKQKEAYLDWASKPNAYPN